MMKTSPMLTLVLLLIAPKLVAETQPAAEYDSDVYHFFVGVEVNIPYEAGIYPLLGLKNNNAVIKVDGKTVLKPIRKIENFQLKKGTKYSTNFVEVETFTCEPGYSVGADPELHAIQTNILLEDMSDLATDDFDNAMRRMGAAEGQLAGAEADTSMDRGARLQSAQQNMSAAKESVSSAMEGVSSIPNYITKGKLGSPAYDQLNVSIRVKAVRPMDNPILVMMVKLKDREDGEVTASWMHFRALGRISTSPSTINFSESSYPDGKLVDSAEIFFFSNGNEVATNLSPKRVDLTAEQIRNFANFQYTTKNLSKTLPPIPAWYVLDPKILRNIDPKLLDATLKLTIDKDGVVNQVRTDADVDQYALDAVKSIMRELIFYPALDKGTAVEGSLDIRLNDYLL